MLRRQNAALYRGQAGELVQLVVRQQGNNGTESAQFEYNGNFVPTQNFGGHPSGTFSLLAGNHSFEVGVVFDPSATAARYDLFQVDAGGGLAPLNASVRSSQSTPVIGFTINGTAAAAPAFAAAGTPPMSPRAERAKPAPRPANARKKTAAKKKAAARKGTARKGGSKKPATRKTLPSAKNAKAKKSAARKSAPANKDSARKAASKGHAARKPVRRTTRAMSSRKRKGRR